MKKRIDVLLVDMGFFPSREQARRTIMAGGGFVLRALFVFHGPSLPGVVGGTSVPRINCRSTFVTEM